MVRYRILPLLLLVFVQGFCVAQDKLLKLADDDVVLYANDRSGVGRKYTVFAYERRKERLYLGGNEMQPRPEKLSKISKITFTPHLARVVFYKNKQPARLVRIASYENEIFKGSEVDEAKTPVEINANDVEDIIFFDLEQPTVKAEPKFTEYAGRYITSAIDCALQSQGNPTIDCAEFDKAIGRNVKVSWKINQLREACKFGGVTLEYKRVDMFSNAFEYYDLFLVIDALAKQRLPIVNLDKLRDTPVVHGYDLTNGCLLLMLHKNLAFHSETFDFDRYMEERHVKKANFTAQIWLVTR